MSFLQESQLRILNEPIYGYSKLDGIPYKPSIKEVLMEWYRSINFIKDPKRKIAPIWIALHGVGLLFFLLFIFKHLTLASVVFFTISLWILATVYNTVWYHRYCSHYSFEFSHKIWPFLFLWFNPCVIREETYAIPHHLHHRFSDKVGDPYGPHLGWLGNYLAQESVQGFNVRITKNEYELLIKSISHIGLKFNSYEEFKRHGCIEKEHIYILRLVFSGFFWNFSFYALGGIGLLIAWQASIFIFTFLMRDFNWRGHGGDFRFKKKAGWEFYENCRALNQHFYGFIAGEWHDNHHLFPASANNAFLKGQIDPAFLLIKSMKRIGVVKNYYDFKDKFLEKNKTSTGRAIK